MITICGEEYSTDITELNLSSVELTTVPEEIKYLTNLRVLDLSFNKITAIPEHIFDSLINLNDLRLNHNKITAIPEHLFDCLIYLNDLRLNDNKITAIPEHLFDCLINLKMLHIAHNKITAIPEYLFDNLINLKTLTLYKNEITAIPEHLFDGLTNLTHLDLSWNDITTIPEHIFDHLTNLQTLYLHYNKITTIPISVLNCRRLEYFRYRGNPLERMDLRIKRFIDNIKNPETHILLNDSQNAHSSVKESINSLMRDPFTMDKEDIIKQLIEVFVEVWERNIGSDFKADLIKRLDEEMIDSECDCLTSRMNRLMNVFVGFYTDINISTSNSE
jgi:Leucine-rich repeat (LRR) protein